MPIWGRGLTAITTKLTADGARLPDLSGVNDKIKEIIRK